MEINPRRVEQQLRNFQRAIDAYDNTEPFARFLTRFFKENKQMGSSDRRMTSRLCYNVFRLGDSLVNLPTVDRLVVSEFLCETQSAIVAFYQPDWMANITSSLTEKILFLETQGYQVINRLFPFTSHLSPTIDTEQFILSHLVQPDLFIRVPQKNKAAVERELTEHKISFEQVFGNAYRLPNGSKLQNIREIDGLYEVQDLSSQQSIEGVLLKRGDKWWDACAASGGKSLLLLDHCPHIDLLVSDIRLSVLRNLDERFDKAKIKTTYRKKVLDLTQDISHLMDGEAFDGILVDAPCSGSGTWGRTPEMLSQFDEERIQAFTTLQRQIVDTVVRYLKPQGTLIYITCSVFEAENEQLVRYLEEEHGLVVEEGSIIKGYNRKSDSMFAARLRKI
ncbi:RsmB/NOP family class I SAM-dependent RNA methyltransferase [Sphingobacterium phlebotomi]|uniref:RsmB/NOP family class I SAM-dependent RNA methyltransferase n=1 Tax=Sphingobacterium phlebotomi TaxID=2605433 RepID=A0A5D4GVJ3_9SPHI|nr:RsmB/NOP family class I SAM-dependent RNA methyltransferase [Sphingobacterium phlebotomi]TYR32174.1 RsmB/NOP family class I SAM-dependent RNA methyltransferase [Sphingobacterium phlebotomi]